MVEVELRFYGAFREYSEQVSMKFLLQVGSGLEELRREVFVRLDHMKPGAATADLLSKSVFADSEDILTESYRFDRSHVLSIIPPVCGG